jgi:glycosyltransferase involved in cell wall biosynthesis
MTKYLFYTENHVFGGGNRYMIALMNALKGASTQIVLYCNDEGLFSSDRKKLEAGIEVNFIRVFSANFMKNIIFSSRFFNKFSYLTCVFLEPFLMILNILFFLPHLYKEKPDKIVVCNGGYPAALSCLSMVLAANIFRIPVMMSIVSMPAERRSFIRLYEKIIDKLVWRSLNMLIVNAQSIARGLGELRDMSVNRVEIIFNGLEDRTPCFLKESEKKRFVIGCVARMDTTKGILVLFEAFIHLAKKYENIKLVLVGQGDASNEIQRRVKVLNFEDRIELIGHFDGDVFKYIDTFDVYVFPSLWEGLPYSIIEAMCAAKPIVTTKVGGIPEVITDGVEGLLINPNSVSDIVDSINKLIKDKKLAKKISKNARKRFEQALTYEHMKKNVQDIFK